MMRAFAILITALTLCTAALAQWPGPPPAPPIDEDLMLDGGEQILPLRDVLDLVHQRYVGKLLAVRLTPPAPHEHARGAELVYELRLLTKTRNVIYIRMDARSGAYYGAAGKGLVEARRKDNDR